LYVLISLQIVFIMIMTNIITIEPGKREGKPCIRGMRITVYDILSWLANGMSFEEIISDFPELNKTDILAALEYASQREQKLVTV
jgi:uncharacterized protein (DUF433 family)